jgi:methylmalonyl-CoA mutase, N-terminal domain
MLMTLHIDPQAEARQRERVIAFKQRRDVKKVEAAKVKLTETCRLGANVMPDLIDAVEHGVSLGEVSDIYREVFGVYRDPGII